MPSESFLVTALPHSADPAAPFHVSLYVGHRLVPDGPQGVVGDFPHVRDWTSQLDGAEVVLWGRRPGSQPEQVPARVVSARQASLWPEVFPPDLLVQPWETKDPTSLPWQTFPASRMDSHARRTHEEAIVSSPVRPPAPTDLTFLDDLLTSLHFPPASRLLGGEHGRGGRSSGAVDRLLRGIVDWDAAATAVLDEGNAGVPVRGLGTAGPWSQDQLVADVHAARRYYQRSEDEVAHQPEPTPGQQPPPRPTPPPQEFHRRLGRLGDLSPLLRALGIVIDLAVDDVGQLTGLTLLSASIVVPGLANGVPSQPQTACAVSGHLFTATTASTRWAHGMLRLGDERLFTLLDLDPDASALKLEQYVRTVPRLLALEGNGNAPNAAPPALRATGFALAEQDRVTALHDRVAGAPAKAAAVLDGTGPPLVLEQVSRGIRLEVWDDVSRAWHSLHRRLVSVVVAGRSVLDRAEDTGFLQGASVTSSDTAPTTAYAHEVLAGWDGWSLAAPRPEKVVVHDSGSETITDPADLEKGVEPVDVTSLPAPGTLPRLRYGRSYAFRAFSVDLAGNSVEAQDHPEAVAPAAAALAQAAAHLLALRRTAVDGVRERPRSRVVPAFEEQLRTSGPSPTPASDLGALATRGVVAQLAAARTLQAPLATDHRQALEAAFGAAAGRAPYVLERSDARTPVETLTAALDSALQSGLLAAALTPAQLTPLLLDVVTVPRPFLRWAPLVEPAVVPRYRYTEGESLLRLVVRSGVDAEGVVTDPVTYGAATRAAHPELVLDWRADSQRHLAPPKTSMVEAEMHGSLDEAVGAAPAAARKKVLGIALREGGTFLLPDVADLDHPGQVLPVQGLSFELGPTADPLEGTPVPTPATLRRGDPLLPGQYAVHDIDDLQVPYLPDPLASGLSFVFPDADLGLQVFEKKVGHLGAQSLTLRYPGTWPALSAYRLVLVSGDRLDGVVEGGVVTVTLPPGEQLRLRLSSAVEPGALDLFGLWRTLHPSIKDVPQIADAAADGWLWWLTPAAEMTLVHAVPRPVTAPRFTVLQAVRQPGATTADLVAGIEVHAPSTDSLDVEASWSEWHDDVAKPAPERVTVQSTACSVPVAPAEPVVVLTGGLALSWSHLAVHHLGDTRHRTVDYVARGTTRYREFFPVQVASGKEELSLVSAPRTVRLPSTVRPPKVVVHDVLPLFRWSEETEAAQPFGVRRTRRTGVRVYLDRPWYATGDGELLAVVVGTATATSAAPSVSQWASDPVWLQSGPADASALPLVDPLHLLGFDDRHDAGRPVTGLVPVQLVDLPNAPAVSLLGYQPEYNAERQLWFLDVDLDAGAAFWPFVRLAVARYQPDSLPGLALGPVVLTDFAQLTPERSTAVARTHDGRVKVAVTGSVGLPRPWEAPVRVGRGPVGVAAALAPSRRMHVRLERRVPEVGTDLGWEVLSAAELPVLSNLGSFVTWEGLVDLPPSDPARPGHGSDLRIVVEEEERLQADPAGPLEGGALRTGSRVVYLDQVLL